MNLNLFFALLGGLLVLAFIANHLVRYTRVPDVIILMATGALIGPVLHWINPDIFRGATHGFGTLALILILFEGGLDLKLREILQHFGAGFFLTIFSYILSMAAVAGLCRLVLHFPWLNALLIGAVLGCISGSILLPVLQRVNLRRGVKVTMLVEASLSDALAVLAVTTLLDIASGGNLDADLFSSTLYVLTTFARHFKRGDMSGVRLSLGAPYFPTRKTDVLRYWPSGVVGGPTRIFSRAALNSIILTFWSTDQKVNQKSERVGVRHRVSVWHHRFTTDLR